MSRHVRENVSFSDRRDPVRGHGSRTTAFIRHERRIKRVRSRTVLRETIRGPREWKKKKKKRTRIRTVEYSSLLGRNDDGGCIEF